MKKKALFFALSSIIVIVLILIKLSPAVPPLSQEQKKQAFENILGRDVRETKNIPQGEKVYKGKYFSLSYPAYAKIYERKNPNITNNKNLLEFFRLDSENPKLKFVAMVSSGDGLARLEELSGVRSRKQNKQYIEMPLVVDGTTGILFIKAIDGVERSSFFLMDGKSYSFVITGVDANALEKIYQQIMKSLQLLQ